MVFAHDVWNKSLNSLMDSIREKLGSKPVYFTFDIDGIDPSYCPGTGMINFHLEEIKVVACSSVVQCAV